MKTPALSLPFAALLAVAAFASAASARAADPPTAVSAATPSTNSSLAPQIDDAAMALLKKSQAAMLAPKSYRAECWTTQTFDPSPDGKTQAPQYEMATLTAEKPNLMRYDSWGMAVDAQGKWTKRRETPVYTFVCDGKRKWMQFGSTYRTDTLVTPKYLYTVGQEPWGGFYDAQGSAYGSTEYYKTHNGKILELRLDGRESVDGVVCDKVLRHATVIYEGTLLEYRTTWYIGPDNLVHRQVEHAQVGDSGNTRDAILRHLQTNFAVPNPKTLFAYVPPKGVESEAERKAKEPKLLAKGAMAPDFTAVDKDGVSIKLSDLKGKIVVIDFWASWCGPCKASMPHTQEVAKKLQAANVPLVLLAVDDGEEKADFAKWVKAHPELDALRFVYSDQRTDVSGKSYHVSGIPTQYVIDAKGVVRTSFVGYGGPTGDLEKAIRAAAEPLK